MDLLVLASVKCLRRQQIQVYMHLWCLSWAPHTPLDVAHSILCTQGLCAVGIPLLCVF